MKVRVLAPVLDEMELEALLEVVAAQPLQAPFSDVRLECCVQLSRMLFADPETRRYPELQALAFWLRKTALLLLRDEFAAMQRPGILRVPRGTVFHIPPSNVDTIFIYSWTMALLTGNRSVVRISSKNSPMTLTLCRLLRSALTGSDHGQFFVQYSHDAAITAALSKACDVRVIWGGDHTVRAIREYAIPVHAKELTFPNRYSLCAVSAAAWLATASEVRTRLAQQFYNDTFWFDQMACSSPRVLIWCGEDADCRGAAAGFYTELEAEITRRGYHLDPGVRMQKLLFASRAIIDQPVVAYEARGAQLSVLELDRVDGINRDHCGGGMFFQFHTAALADIAPHVRRQDQTLTCFGFAAGELRAFAELLQGRGIDRIVPVGQALKFSRFWDGYDLLEEMTRVVSVP